MRPASGAEKARQSETFTDLCRILSPSWEEAACAERVAAELRAMGLEVERDEAGNLLARVRGRGERTILLCAHLDTVPPVAPIEPVLVDDGWENANAGILGADNKSAVAMILEVARRCSVEGSPVGLELLFTVAEEVGLQGAKRFDASKLRSEFGYVFDHATPIGEIVTASPTLYRIEAEFHGKSAHAGLRPETGRSAILAAAHAAIAMPHGRIDDQTTANLGFLHGGVESTNVVPERARVLAEVRSVDPDRAEEVLAAMIDALHDGASHGECDVDVITEKQVVGYRTKPSSPVVVAAEAALRAHGYEPTPDRHRRRLGRQRPRGRRHPDRQRRQRHRAQPRADRARLRRRAGVDARRRLHPARRGGRGMSARFEKIGTETIYEGKFLDVRRDRFRFEDGEEVDRELVGHPGAVGVVVLDDDDNLWFVRQPREAIGIPDLLEIPAGKLDVEGEDPLRGRQARARRGDRQAGRPLGVARLVLHLARLRGRGDPPLPRHGHLGRRAARGRGGRADRRRGAPVGRPGRDPGVEPGLEDARRAVPAPRPLAGTEKQQVRGAGDRRRGRMWRVSGGVLLRSRQAVD